MINEKNQKLNELKTLRNETVPPFTKDGYINILPKLKCTVEFMEKTKKGFMRQPVYKCLKLY